MAGSTDETTSADEQSVERTRRDPVSSITISQRAAWVAVAIAAAGLAFGLLPLAYGELGEAPTTEVTEQSEQPQQEPSAEAQAFEDAQFTNQAVQIVINLAPYFGVLLGAVAGLVVGAVGGGTDQELAIGAAVGALAGVVAFVVLTSGIAITQWETVQAPVEIADRTVDYGAAAVNGVAAGIPAAIGAGIAAYAGDRLTA